MNPEQLTLIRHEESEFNRLRTMREGHPLYISFKAEYEADPESEITRKLAEEVKATFPVNTEDHLIPLPPDVGEHSRKMARQLRNRISPPDVVFTSPYLRAKKTLEHMTEGWPELNRIETIEDDRVRERDHGMALTYGDWRVFFALHPQERELRNLQGKYLYPYPKGESIPAVRDRLNSWMEFLKTDHPGKRVLTVTHSLVILSIRANLEDLTSEEFERLDKEDDPINAGVTIYNNEASNNNDEKMTLSEYNLKLY